MSKVDNVLQAIRASREFMLHAVPLLMNQEFSMEDAFSLAQDIEEHADAIATHRIADLLPATQTTKE